MPSRLAHQREATTQSIKTTTEPRFTLKGVPMPPVMKTFLRRLSGDRLFPKKPQPNNFRTNYTSRSSISTSTPSPSSSAIFSYEPDRTFSQSSAHVSERAATPPPFNVHKEIKKVDELYDTALEEMRYVEDSKGTYYYREDHETARKAIEECMCSYDSLLNVLLCETDRNEVRECLATKLQELKAQFDALPPDTPREV